MSSGRTWVVASSKTSPQRLGSACLAESASPHHLPTSITMATRTCSSPLFLVAMCYSRMTDMRTSGTSLKRLASIWSAILPVLVCNVGKYTSDKRGTQGQYVGLPDAFAGHLHPERYEYPVLYKNIGHNQFKDVTAEVGLRPIGWCGDATFTDFSGSGFPGLFILNM